MNDEQAHWPKIATRWHLVGPPLRPSKEDIALFERSIGNLENPTEGIRGLILGVTPELYQLRWPRGSTVRALDGSLEMIKAIWPGPADSALLGSWTAAPVAGSSQNVILCDGGFGVLSFPHEQRQLLTEVRRMLAPGGIFVVRLFAPAGRTGSIADISADLHAGLIESLDMLKLRLWGALQKTLVDGVKPREVVANIEEMSGGLDRLVVDHGWSAEHVATLELHRDSNSVYHLANAEELVRMTEEVSGFEVVSIESADYSYSDCCPLVTLRRENS